MRLLLVLLLTCVRLCADDFHELMGEKTEHWKWLKEKIDIESLQRFHTLYLKNKESQFEVKAAFKIPKVIHFIWLGPNPFPCQSVENIRSWRAHHPDWTIKLWTDRPRDLPCEGVTLLFVHDFPFTKLKRCFETSENWGEKSDILRYEILWQEGGVYVDHDVLCLRSFEGLHRGYDLYVGLEPPHEAFADRHLTCNNGLIGARAHHPVLQSAIDSVLHRWDPIGTLYRGKDPYSKTEVVMRRTYIAFTQAVEQELGTQGNCDIVFPAGYFFAKTGIRSLYAKHLFNTLWDESRIHKSSIEKAVEKDLSKLKTRSRVLLLVLCGLVLCNGLIFVLSMRKL